MPHSEIHGSKLIRSSPWLIAAYHVLHRLCMPRHPPDALISLDHSHRQCSPFRLVHADHSRNSRLHSAQIAEQSDGRSAYADHIRRRDLFELLVACLVAFICQKREVFIEMHSHFRRSVSFVVRAPQTQGMCNPCRVLQRCSVPVLSGERTDERPAS